MTSYLTGAGRVKENVNEGYNRIFENLKSGKIDQNEYRKQITSHRLQHDKDYRIAHNKKQVALSKAAAKKNLEKSVSDKGKQIGGELSDKGKDIPKEGGGSNKAALASAGLKLAGMESDSAGGGAIEGGLQAAAMTGNPYIIGGAAILGALQGSAKRKAHNKAMDAKAELGAAQAHATGAAQSQAAMGQMSRAFSQYFS